MNQRGVLHLLLLLAGAGILIVFLIFSFAPFKDKLLGSLFPKNFLRAAAITNLLTNGDFENDFSNWNQGGWSITTNAYSGLKSAHFASNSNLIQNFSNLKTSTQYKVSFWVKLNSQTCPAGGCWGDFRSSLGNNDWRNQFAGPDAVSVATGNTTPGVWTKKSFTFTTGTVTSGELWLHNWGTYTFDVDIDEVKLFEVPQTPIPPAVSISTDKINLTSTADAVSFTSRADDDDGSVNYYFWDFGDGGKSNLPNPQYKYSSNGTYTARLIVYDDSGQSAQAQTLITLTDPDLPNLTIASPSQTTFTSPIISFSGTSQPGTGKIISKVEYSTDRGVYGTAAGTSNWNFTLDLTGQGGKHRIMVNAFDSSGKIAKKELVVDYRPANKVNIVGGAAGIVQNAASVERYDKFEATFKLENGVYSNPDVPYETSLPAGMSAINGNGLTIEASFKSPSGKFSVQPGFYYQPYQRNTATGQLIAQGEPVFKIRFSPQETGTWTYQITVTDASGSTTISDNTKLTFTVTNQTNSDNHGFIKVSEKDKRYFEFSDGTPFIGVGPGPAIRSSFDTDINISKFVPSSANLSRTWMSGGNIAGSSWAPWSGRIDNVSNSPGTSMTTEEAYGDGVFSLTLPQQGPGAQPQPAGNCFFYGHNGIDASVKPDTNYRVMLRVKSVGITGPGGFTFRPGVGWPDTCDKFAGQPLTVPYVQGTKDWHVITGSWNSGNKTKLGIGLLTLENVTGGRVYIDEVSIREDLGNGQFGPEVLSRSKFNVQNYFSQEPSWNWDYGLDEFAKRGIYEKPVIEEKDDYSFNYISPYGYGYDKGGQMGKSGSLKYQSYFWRYLIARYGYSRAVHSWEYANEQAPGSLSEAQELAKYLKANDPNKHMGNASNWAGLNGGWTNPAFQDVSNADAHSYAHADGSGTSWLNNATYPLTLTNTLIPTFASLVTDSALFTFAHSVDQYLKNAAGNKPMIIGEAGIINGATTLGDNDTDTKGIWWHQYVWAQLNNGAAYFIYWYDNTIKSNGLSSLVVPYRQFFEGKTSDTVNTRVPLNNGNYGDIQLTLPAGIRGWGQKDIVNGGAHFWVYDSGYTWTTPSGGTPIGGKTVSFDGLPAKDYTVEFWDTWTGDVTKQDLNHPGGVINLTVPASLDQKDAAVKIYPTTGFQTTQVTPSPTASASSVPAKPGDIDGDEDVDIFDYNQLLTDFGKTGTGLVSDIEQFGTSANKVDIFDYNLLLTNFGK